MTNPIYILRLFFHSYAKRKCLKIGRSERTGTRGCYGGRCMGVGAQSELNGCEVDMLN